MKKKIRIDNSFSVMMSLVFMASLLPTQLKGGFSIIYYMAQDLGISINDATSSLFIMFSFGLVLGQFMIGPLSDKFGRLPIFIIFLNIFSISSLFCSLFYSPQWFDFFRLISGFTVAVGIIISRTIIADNCDLKNGT